MEKWQAPKDLLSPLNDLKSHGFDTLLQGLFWDLKVAEPRAQALGVGGLAGAGWPRGRHSVGCVCPGEGPWGPGAWPQRGLPGWEDTEKLQHAPT